VLGSVAADAFGCAVERVQSLEFRVQEAVFALLTDL
jgi:hypothetical protein